MRLFDSLTLQRLIGSLRQRRRDAKDLQRKTISIVSDPIEPAEEEMGHAAVIEKFNTVLGGEPIYISIDIDGLDPAYMPGTGVPEIGGILPRDMQVILRLLQGKNIAGGEICEITPCFNPTGIIRVTVANLMFEILCITADSMYRKRCNPK